MNAVKTPTVQNILLRVRITRVLPSGNEITLLMLTLIMLAMFGMMALLEYIRRTNIKIFMNAVKTPTVQNILLRVRITSAISLRGNYKYLQPELLGSDCSTVGRGVAEGTQN
jgi:ABC-type protease/lipase transport system fused ATPase/permease subunit